MAMPNRWLMMEGDYGRAPVVCVDSADRCYVAWISCGGNERVRFSMMAPGKEWSSPVDCSPPASYITALSMARFRDGVLVAWIDGGTAHVSGLKLVFISGEQVGDHRTILDGGVFPAYPALAAVDEGFWLFMTVREGRGRRLTCAVGGGLDDTLSWRRLTDGSTKAMFVAAAADQGRVGVIWQEMGQGANWIRSQSLSLSGEPEEDHILVSDEQGVTGAPTIAPAGDGGWWAAWHSDRDTEAGPSLVRWIDLVRISRDGTVRYPTSLMPGIERFGRGEDQGYEFPQLVANGSGVVVIGRGSQSYRRQDFGPEGWGAPSQIDEPGWSCRGRRVSVAGALHGLYIANREKDGIAVRRLPFGEGTSDGDPPMRTTRSSVAAIGTKVDPIKKRTILAGYRVLFGDIHQHTAASDGTGTMEETYYRARVRYGDKVVAVSDHESFLGKKTPEGEWREATRIADEFYSPGSFVTLDAYEWTGKMHPGPGHKVVYLPPAGGPLFSRDSERTGTSRGLLQACHSLGAVVVPHHVGWTGADMENHRPDVQTCFEVVSCHGAYERANFDAIGTRGDDKPGQFILDCLDENLRFGLTGGSDGHGLSWHHGVSRVQDSHRTGLTGFLCHEVTREAVFEALKKRRCYATSGAKIGVWFEVDGRPMGEELMAAMPVPFRVMITASSPIVSLCLVTNGGQEIALRSGVLDADSHGTLPPPPKNGFSYYFVRVTQDDGHVAWSSPVWLDPLASA